ncbi:MAG: hypothetical protein ACI4WS_13535 [Oscillospiraceae bacterium]
MITPKLDGRSVNDIISEIKRKSESYTPEWRFDPSKPDGGAALAQLFSEMFYETIDRYNRFPDKCYLEFLNMLGVSAGAVSPAVGMASAVMVDGAQNNVFVPKGTRLFTDINGESGEDVRVVFETSSGFYAVPAEIKALYMTDHERDIITRSDLSAPDVYPISLFRPDEGSNLERHCFAAAHSAALRINGAAEIRVRLTNKAMSYQNEAIAEKLCDGSAAKWSYLSPSGRVPLTAHYRQGYIALLKDSLEPVEPVNLTGDDSAEPNYWIFCEMSSAGGADDITVDEIAVSSASTDDELRHGILADSLFANDTELNTERCGYCFGREPSAYDSFYISCGEVFSKRGADIVAEFTLDTVVYQDNSLIDNGLDFNQKLVVDKDDAKAVQFDNIYISEVIWEYWNGFGWARLEVSGDVNPFSCEEQTGKKTIRFVCPEDMEISMQNAHEGYWIRARIVSVENRFSVRGRWLIPLLKGFLLRYDYGTKFLPAEEVQTTNNCTIRNYSHGSGSGGMSLFSRMPEQHHAVYLLFDKPPEGYPFNLYMEFAGSSNTDRVLSFQHLTGDGGGRTSWVELKVNDRTEGFSRSGILSMFCPGDFTEEELFGERGYWIRVVNRSMDLGRQDEAPQLVGATKNAVDIVQKQSVTGERHDVFAGKADQSFRLAGSPVIGCELWVNELAETPLAELLELQRRDSAAVREVRSGDGQISEFWVRWEARETLVKSAPDDRHYELDRQTGMVRFGNGVNGMIPAYHGLTEASCDYSFGGGKAGNLPAGAIDGLIVGIPFVESMTNFRPTCGGSSSLSIETIRRIGTRSLKHRGRAVSVQDYETMVLEEFSEVREVRCFADSNSTGKTENGCVTVVIMPYDYADSVYIASLCRKIYDFISKRTPLGLAESGRLCVIPAGVMRISSEITLKPDDYEYAAEAEQNAETAVRSLLNGSSGGERIGRLPGTNDIIAALRKAEHVAYVSGVMLIGEYYRGTEKVTVPLSDTGEYKYFVSASGTHIIKF